MCIFIEWIDKRKKGLEFISTLYWPIGSPTKNKTRQKLGTLIPAPSFSVHMFPPAQCKSLHPNRLIVPFFSSFDRDVVRFQGISPVKHSFELEDRKLRAIPKMKLEARKNMSSNRQIIFLLLCITSRYRWCPASFELE